MTRPVTVKEIAELFNIDKDTAYGFIRFCLAIDAAVDRGVRKPEGGRGRGENVYSIRSNITDTVATFTEKFKTCR